MLAGMFIALPVTTVIAQAASASPAAAATSDAAVTARAKDWFHQIQTGKVDRSQLDDKMNAALTDSVLSSVSAKIAPLGDPSAFTLRRARTALASTSSKCSFRQ
jgi:ABC-type transporter MlaC component